MAIFVQDVPEAAQIESLIKLIAWLNQYYASSNPQDMDIKLHREVAATVCPGKLFPVEQIRRLKQVAASGEGGNGVDDWKNDLMQEAQRIGLIQEEHQPDDPAPKWFVLAVALHILEFIKNGGKGLGG